MVWEYSKCKQVISKARFPLPELTGRQHGPSTRVVKTGAVNTARVDG